MKLSTRIRFMNMLAYARLQLLWTEGLEEADAADYYDLIWAARDAEQESRNRVRKMIREGANPKLFREFNCA